MPMQTSNTHFYKAVRYLNPGDTFLDDRTHRKQVVISKAVSRASLVPIYVVKYSAGDLEKTITFSINDAVKIPGTRYLNH